MEVIAVGRVVVGPHCGTKVGTGTRVGPPQETALHAARCLSRARTTLEAKKLNFDFYDPLTTDHCAEVAP